MHCACVTGDHQDFTIGQRHQFVGISGHAGSGGCPGIGGRIIDFPAGPHTTANPASMDEHLAIAEDGGGKGFTAFCQVRHRSEGARGGIVNLRRIQSCPRRARTGDDEHAAIRQLLRPVQPASGQRPATMLIVVQVPATGS